MPDTGSLATDLRMFLDAVVAALSDPVLLRLFHALSASSADAEADLGDTLRAFWQTRYATAGEMIARAIERGDLSPGIDPHAIIEQLVAPAYFRALVTGERLDADLARRSVQMTLAAVR